ncbi:ABC transporter ATP-binding protein [Clostridium sp.]|uniref:ABC transporter ATP-binding protein n=1 Tax=Clostridium sp. TaxID=1506 RepID=UPI0035A19E56
MISALKKIWEFSGTEKHNISKSILVGFIFAVFYMFQVAAIYFIIVALVNKESSNNAIWISLSLLIVSILGRTITNYFAQLQQTHAGYFMVANKRIAIGNQLKKVPMGYFNNNSIGEITGITTTVLDDVENTAPMVLVNILSGFINAVIFTLMVLFFNIRLGMIVIIGSAIYLWITSSMERKSSKLAPKRQQSEAKLVEAVIEQVQGMHIVKSFNLTGKGDKKVRDALEYNRSSNLKLERLFTPYTIAQEMVLRLFSVLTMVISALLYLNGQMALADALMGVVISFMIFAQIESAGSTLSVLRVVSSSIDHANQMDSIPQMDNEGKAIVPKTHEIEFENVCFSYDKKRILEDISITFPDKTMTAIVGPSGSGKTTICNLIARFWDVDSGRISIGGKDVKYYTLEVLMDQISMVFQNVYLFADTIENNIKFGRPDASYEEVVQASKKACCHDFITSLPNGYNTFIGEGGNLLSGGEKQRISIARAMLKDAPIVIFDEATANVDPENEDKLQSAIEELTKNKTIIMIAHRLKTVKNAEQILVMNHGKIEQQGKHEELLVQRGIYSQFINARQEAISWKVGVSK